MATGSSSSSFTYDAFLSFREETRYSFTGNLCRALRHNGIHTFMDDDFFHNDHEMTSVLEKEIEDSRIFIIVFSQDYASSSFCLNELAYILECVKRKGLLVFPVFYNVDPSHMRDCTGSFGEALANHEAKFKAKMEGLEHNMEKQLEKWKMALHETANLYGYLFKQGDGYEYDFIKRIVELISSKINQALLDVTDYPVGLESCSDAFSYDVFVSFRGLDTRYGFTGNLYNALRDEGIHTFVDHKQLQIGENIQTAHLKAIENSKIFIIVLSQNYASSSFCLDELATILHCDQRKQLVVIPVFYNVDPSDVRHRKGSYGEALTKFESRLLDDPEKLQKWKMALQQVADLSGYHFKDRDGYEYKFIEKIVEQVSRVINLCPLHVADYPVGLKSRVSDVRKLLDAGSDDGAHMIGIHGMGGVGKSTLARAVYNELTIAEKFDGLCFLANVRENSNKHGLEHLQRILLCEILGEKNINLTSRQHGISIIQSRLTGKKVLLILDDVGTHEQLQAIAGRPDWFGRGSKIIITTRDKRLLASHAVNKTYEVKELNENDALQLLTWKAFKKEKADPTYVEVLHRAVTYASGLPLALEVIGSALIGKSIEEWRHAIKQYKRIPRKEILEILKVNFDALAEEEKSVFLDIACCLKGREWKEVEHILGCLYDDRKIHHIGVLVEKSIIEVSWDGIVNMNNSIQDMGRRIDQQESSKEPGKRRRLWLTKDIIQVLEENSGSSKIEIIYLDFFLSKKEATIKWDGNAFKTMKNLKILIIRNGKFSKGPKYFPESLRVLEWHRYPSNCLPSNFDPKELVICKLPHSCITSFGFHGSRKKFGNLKVLNFDESEFLTEIPDVSNFPNLEELSFDRCRNLITVHPSIGFLNKLKILSARYCSKLTSFPPLYLTSLESLELSNCFSLENFPEILGAMENLRKLFLKNLTLKELPVSFQNLVGLERLFLHNCEIGWFPSSIVVMPKLSFLKATSCKGWQWVKSEEGEEKVSSIVPSNVYDFTANSCNLYDDFFSTGFMQLGHMETLCLRNNNFTFLPECIKEFQFLRRLDVSGCLHLQEIRGVPPNLVDFMAIECISLSSSSSSMLLNQELHKAGQSRFRFPGASIPEWFKQKSRGPSSSFWFRNEFPDNVLCLLIARVQCISEIDHPMPMVFINGRLHEIISRSATVKKVELCYTYLFDLKSTCKLYDDDKEEDDLFEVALEKEWNHVEITYEGRIETSVVKATGIHVFRQDDIRYDDPYGKRILHHDLNSSESQPHIKKRRISRWVGPERIRKLLWKAADGALITNAERRYRHISMDSCRRCGVLEETCLHALRDCPDVAAFWRSVLPKQLVQKFFKGDVTVWLETNLSFSAAAVFWPTFFGIAVELLWEFRNERVFYHDDYRWAYFSDVSDIVLKRYKDFMRGHASHNLMTRNLLKWRRRPEHHEEWLLRLKVSGAFDPSSGTAACGGIFTDYNCIFVLGYSVKLGECSSKDEAEIWGIYHGMKIARQCDIWAVYRDHLRQRSIPISPEIKRQNDYGKIGVESGSQKAIDFVLDGCPTSTYTCTSRSLQHCFPLCHELQALTSATNHLYFFCIKSKAAESAELQALTSATNHIFCRADENAESFAKFSLSMKEQASIFYAAPPFCRACMHDDVFEVDLEKEWNHVEITYSGVMETSLVKATGIHVLRQDDIRYDDPYDKRKIDHDLNSSEPQPLIKKHVKFPTNQYDSVGLESCSDAFSYDVFLSFIGSDTLHGFTGYLYKALHDSGIHTFINEELQRGEEITPAIVKTIETSRIAIIVVSTNYASSSLFLDELVTILDCLKRKSLLVLPVFYNVDPSHLQPQKGSYGEALAKHEERFKHNMEKLEKWNMVLYQVANLSGFHIKHGTGYEYEFIGEIVEWVTNKINPAHYTVGLGPRVLDVKKLLDGGCDDGIHMLGIYGVGGVGKSRLAREVYNNLIAEHFDASCFIENVREKSAKHVQNILLSKILGEKDINLISMQEGISMVQSRLQPKKVLLILDDVDRHEQLNAVVERTVWLGPGSIVIITTRDKRLLEYLDIDKSYEVKGLSKNDALQFLNWKAFKTQYFDPRYEEVLNRAVTYASGLPLALEIIGSNLFGKSVEEWESSIYQFEKSHDNPIQVILKASFDSLEEKERSVFLDIACCFKGYELAEVQDILHAHYGHCIKYYIDVLVGKSLVKLSHGTKPCYDTVTLHDLIEGMGKEINRLESLTEPGKRRRLRLPEDIREVLGYNKGTSKIEIICLDFPIFDEEAIVEWDGKAFQNMQNLKTLIIRNCNFSKGPEYLPNSLRVLEWWRYPSHCLPSDFHPKELSICKLPCSHISTIELTNLSRKCVNLRVLNFSSADV